MWRPSYRFTAEATHSAGTMPAGLKAVSHLTGVACNCVRQRAQDSSRCTSFLILGAVFEQRLRFFWFDGSVLEKVDEGKPCALDFNEWTQPAPARIVACVWYRVVF